MVGRYIDHEPDSKEPGYRGPLGYTKLESIRNFNEDYLKYFGDLAPAWSFPTQESESVSDDIGILNKNMTVKQILAVNILFSIVAAMSFFLLDFYLVDQSVLSYFIPIGIGIIGGGALLSFKIKDPAIVKIVGFGIVLLLETLILLALVFTIFCKNGPDPSLIIFEGLFLLINSFILVSLLAPSKFKGKSGTGGGCGSGAGAAGCGGGGCGGGGGC